MKQAIEKKLWEEFEEELNKAEQIKVKFTTVISKDNSEKLAEFWKLFLNEQLPTGQINEKLEKNFAIYIVHNQLDIETIKQKYQAQGWNPNALLGWIRKVVNGEITELNIGELVLWAKKFKPELVQLICNFGNEDLSFELVETEKVKRINPFKKLHYSTDHLPLFHEFSTLTGLYGRQYIPILKARWYQLHGGVIQKIVRLGSLVADTRIHVAYPLVTEGGKNEIIYSIKRLVETGIKKNKTELFRVSEPVSFHQESLIGKSVERLIDNPECKPKKIKVRIENKGHLDCDFIEFDECNQLISSNSPDFQQAREYLSKAENPIGKNKVEKRSVDDLPEETVAYCPKSTHSYYFQPFKKLPEGFVLQGFGRRKIIPVGNIRSFLIEPSQDLFNEKLKQASFSETEYSERIVNHLQNLRDFSEPNDFSFTDSAIQKITECSLYISEQAYIHSEKVSNFAKISKWTSLANLVKMSCIIAGSYFSSQVTEKHVALAYMDLVELMQNTYDFIYERILGDFDYGVKWGGADYQQREALVHLYNHGFFSKESSGITIHDFITKILKPIYKVGEAQARNRYIEMKKKKLIDSGQLGQNSSRVWLNPITLNTLKDFTYKSLEGSKGDKGYIEYNRVFLTKNKLMGECNPSYP